MTCDEDEDDNSLVRRVANGDASAYEVLYRRYYKRLLAIATKVTHRQEEAEDIAQDTMLKLWYKSGMYDPTKGTFAKWLGSVCHNVAVDYKRDREAKPTLDFIETLDSERVFVDEEEQNIARVFVYFLLTALPKPAREAIELVYLHGLLMRDAASVLGCPIGTIKTRCRRAYQQMYALATA